MQEELKLRRINEDITVKKFAPPTCDIEDQELANKQLEEFLALDTQEEEE